MLKSKNFGASNSRNRKTDVSLIEKETMDLDTLLDIYLHNDKDGVCCICGKPYHDYGANAMPLVDGRCCKECDRRFVIPSRIQLLKKTGVHYTSLEEGVFTKDTIREIYETRWNK